jgi:hypothetical protein
MRKIACAVVVFLAATTAAHAQRARIQVAFSFAGHPYGSVYSLVDRDFIEKKVQSDIRDFLAGVLPPFEFVAPGSGGHELRIVLRSDPNGTPNNRKIQFDVAVDASVHPLDPHWMIDYRQAYEAGLPLGTRDAFALDLSSRLKAFLVQNAGQIVPKLFARVRIADNALPLPSQKAFALPFAAADWKMGAGTKFHILATDKDLLETHFTASLAGEHQPGATLPAPFARGARARADESDPTSAISALAAGAPFTAKEVNLLVYGCFQPPQPAPPTDFHPSGGGSR